PTTAGKDHAGAANHRCIETDHATGSTPSAAATTELRRRTAATAFTHRVDPALHVDHATRDQQHGASAVSRRAGIRRAHPSARAPRARAAPRQLVGRAGGPHGGGDAAFVDAARSSAVPTAGPLAEEASTRTAAAIPALGARDRARAGAAARRI